MAQGTIRDFDAADRTGSVLMDDRTEVRIDRGSTVDSGLHTLRLGQRVRFDVVEQEGVLLARKLRILTVD